jgi:protocatechuate 3,4-dioxygenase beta subunit
MRYLLPFQWVARSARAVLVACAPTADATGGPFYRRGAPWRARLCPADEPGEPLSISGTVTQSVDCRPLARATLDVWQTNARGLYSNFFGLQDPSNPHAFNLRGRLMSTDDGHYQFASVLPGRYPLFWPLTRPRHIHLTVTHPGCDPLTTQIFFEGDEYNRRDPWWRASLTIRLEPTAMTGSGRVGKHGVFDIALRPKLR